MTIRKPHKRSCSRLTLWPAIAALLLLAGCAAPGPRFSGLDSVAADKSELIVYRKSAFFASAQTMPVTVDGKAVGELYNASYLVVHIAPGTHEVKASTGPFGKTAGCTVTLAARERKYLQFDFPSGLLANAFFIGDTLDQRDAHTALADLKELSSAR